MVVWLYADDRDNRGLCPSIFSLWDSFTLCLCVDVSISLFGGLTLKIALIQDKYNENKIWIIKKYKDRSIYYNQKVGDKVLYGFNRTSKRFLKSVFETNEEALEIIEKLWNIHSFSGKIIIGKLHRNLPTSLPRLITIWEWLRLFYHRKEKNAKLNAWRKP